MILSQISNHEEVRLLRFVVKQLGVEFKPVYCFSVDGLLIDTAMSKAGKAVSRILDDSPPEQIVLTHHHEDHSGNISLLSKRYQIPAFAHPLTIPIVAEGVPVFFYQRLSFGRVPVMNLTPIPDLVETHNHQFQVIHTPGHAPDQISLLEPNRGWLFSGDLYVAERIKYFKRGEVMKDQINSIRTLLTYDFDTLFCCHNPKLENGKERLAAKLAYLEHYYEQARDLYQQGYPPMQIIKKMGLKEGYAFRLFSTGDVSALNMVNSALIDLKK